MKDDQSVAASEPGSVSSTPTNNIKPKKLSLSEGLLMVPKTAGYSTSKLGIMPKNSSKHKRNGSTGTTGDEYTTDEEEDNIDIDEPDSAIKERVTGKLFGNNHDFGYSHISTIADKVHHLNVMHRNSSDSSVYSDLEKCGLEAFDEELNDEGDSVDADSKSGCTSGSSSTGGSDHDQVDWAGSLEAARDQAYLRLQSQLKEANDELKLRDEELGRLNRIRRDVETELEDLTASLFQEAHNMVREANEKQAAAEKALKESQMKVDVLTAEVAALKTLVLTSTPSHPNPHLHPQIDVRAKDEAAGVAIFTKKQHRRSPSHFNLKYGRENSPPSSPVKEAVLHISSENETRDGLEVDPVLQKEFLTWKEQPMLDKTNAFIKRIYDEDINLCLSFTNRDLSEKVMESVESGTILIEAVGDKTKAMFPKKCALLEVPRLCFYRMNIGEAETWYSISQICRNRIIAVCDFLNYLKYIERDCFISKRYALNKHTFHAVLFWRISARRKE